MGGYPKPFTEEELRAIRDFYERDGVSIEETALSVGMGKERVRRALEEMGVTIRGLGSEPEHIPTLEEIWEIRTKEIQARWTDKQRQRRVSSLTAVPWKVPKAEVSTHRKKLPSSND